MTDKELASAAGVSTRTIAKYREQGCKATTPAQLEQWRGNHVRLRHGGPKTGPPTAIDKQAESLQLRTLRAEAEKAEEDARGKKMENDRKAGLLMERAEVQQDAAAILIAVREILESIPDAAAKEVPPKYRARVYDVEKNKVALALRKASQIRLLGRNPDDALPD